MILTWIGLNDLEVEGQWKWSDSTNMDYTAWYREQPNAGREGNCAFTNCARQWCDPMTRVLSFYLPCVYSDHKRLLVEWRCVIQLSLTCME